jgi:hypothetical protein
MSLEIKYLGLNQLVSNQAIGLKSNAQLRATKHWRIASDRAAE